MTTSLDPGIETEIDAAESADVIELAVNLRFSIARLARLLRQQAADGLGSTLVYTLATIDREGPMTLGDVATAERVSPPTITAAVGKLEALGFVARVRDERDGRVWRVETTDAGRDHLATTRTRRTAWLVERLQQLSPADIAHLEAATKALAQLGSIDPPAPDVVGPR